MPPSRRCSGLDSLVSPKTANSKAQGPWETSLGAVPIGDPNAAQETFDQLTRFARALEPDQMIPAIQAIIEAQVAAGDFVAALEAILQFGDAGERLDALTGMTWNGTSIRRSWNGFSG